MSLLATEHVRSDGVTQFGRQEFAENRFDYRPGQHVVFGGPSQMAGKTTLAFDLLQYVATPELPAYVAVSKPDDKVSTQAGKRLGFRRVSQWPPDRKFSEIEAFGGTKPRGYLIWPEFGDIDRDNEEAARVTGDLLKHTYAGGAKQKHAILVMDDTMVKAKILGLDGRMVTILAMAGAMGIGIWTFVQKPTDSGRTSLWAFENSQHLFFAKGGDTRMLQRYVEISGEFGPSVKKVVPTLRPYEFAYLNKFSGHFCVVGAS